MRIVALQKEINLKLTLDKRSLRKVYQAVSSESEIYFAELPIRPTKADTAASIQCGKLRVDIHAGADGETIHAIIQALKSC